MGSWVSYNSEVNLSRPFLNSAFLKEHWNSLTLKKKKKKVKKQHWKKSRETNKQANKQTRKVEVNRSARIEIETVYICPPPAHWVLTGRSLLPGLVLCTCVTFWAELNCAVSPVVQLFPLDLRLTAPSFNTAICQSLCLSCKFAAPCCEFPPCHISKFLQPAQLLTREGQVFSLHQKIHLTQSLLPLKEQWINLKRKEEENKPPNTVTQNECSLEISASSIHS